jgi:signal transduction histidine kinase/CheY-like chemotaxis protein
LCKIKINENLKSYPLLYESKELGQLIIQVDYPAIKERVFQKTLPLLLANLVKTFIVFIIILLVFNRFLIQPINRLAKYTSELDLEKLNDVNTDFIKMKNQNDEIGVIAKSIEQLKKRLSLDIQRFQEVEKKLHDAHRMEALGKLAAGVAHDFNNILQGVETSLSLSLKQDDVIRSRKTLEKTRAFIDRGKNLIQKIFSFSKPIDGEINVIDIVELTLDTKNVLEQNLIDHSKINFETNTEECFVLGNTVGLHQLLSNLFHNAIDAIAEKGDGEISVVLEKRPTEQIINLTVKDTGIGMGFETQKRIFDPFYTTKDTGKGTGLGMSIILQVVQEMNGEIKVDSKRGVGTTITLSFPYVLNNQKALDDNINHMMKEPTSYKWKNRVIVIDDEVELLETLASTLEESGFNVFAFNDPEEAITQIKNSENFYEFAIIDFSMPKIKGDEVVRYIKENKPQTKIVMSTGLAPKGRVLDSNYDAILKKPYTHDELVKTLENIRLEN